MTLRCGYTAEEFFDIFAADSENNIWICRDGEVQYNSLRTVTAEEMNKNPIEFDRYQYFNNLCRNLIYPNANNPLVHTFCLKPVYHKDLKYIIKSGEKSYSLDISEISLKIFSTGIAVFMIYCTNSLYFETASVKAINEYGRRLAMPYWKTKSDDSRKCADKLEIIGEKIAASDNLSSFHDGQVSLSYISKIIRNLLDRNGKNIIFRAKTTFRKNEIEIKPIWDEKMFVACMITDKELANRLSSDFVSSDGVFSPEEERGLVELINVDPSGKCSLLCEKDRRELLDGSLYTAQLGGGAPKLSAVTEHSYIKILPEEDFDARYFSEIYCQIIVIALMQRMSIAVFREDILSIYKSAGKRGKLTNKEINEVMSLQKKYVAFCNSCLLNEVTPKREGKFIYQKIRSAFDINTENEMLEAQLNRLYELVNTSQGYSFNKWGLIISLIAIEFSAIAFVQTGKSLSETGADLQNGIGVIALFLAIAAAIIFGVQILFRRKK